jgi:hypothetical protein
METFIVILVVGASLILVGRSFYRTLTGKDGGCGCGGACPRSGACAGAEQSIFQEKDTGK